MHNACAPRSSSLLRPWGDGDVLLAGAQPQPEGRTRRRRRRRPRAAPCRAPATPPACACHRSACHCRVARPVQAGTRAAGASFRTEGAVLRDGASPARHQGKRHKWHLGAETRAEGDGVGRYRSTCPSGISGRRRSSSHLRPVCAERTAHTSMHRLSHSRTAWARRRWVGWRVGWGGVLCTLQDEVAQQARLVEELKRAHGRLTDEQHRLADEGTVLRSRRACKHTARALRWCGRDAIEAGLAQLAYCGKGTEVKQAAKSSVERCTQGRSRPHLVPSPFASGRAMA